MKKLLLLAAISTAVIVFSNCHSSKKATAAAPKPTYETNMQPLVMGNCVPCHVPSKGGRMKPYDNYTNVKSDIDEIIRRIELNPGDKGYMPFKKAKLSDSTINAFKQWKETGMLEK
jgi:mono/diheme cytochrome c family protein